MTTQTADRRVQSSELSRNSKSVFAAAEEAPVVVTRRDGENLVLMSEREATEHRKMFELAAQIIAATTFDTGTLAERMSNVFPWMLALTPEAREECADSLIDSARASFSTNQPTMLLIEVTSWFETATARAAGLHNIDVAWLDEPLSVDYP